MSCVTTAEREVKYVNKISIKLRVTAWYTLIMIAISAVAMTAMIKLSRDMITRESGARTVRAVNNLSHVIEGRFDRKLREIDGAQLPDFSPDDKKIPDFRFFDQGVHLAVYDADHNLVDGVMPFEFADSLALNDNQVETKVYGGEQYLVYSKSVKNSDGEIRWITGVAAFDSQGRMMNNMITTNLILTMILIITAAIGGYLILKRAFRPVDIISCTAKEISESTDLTRRIALHGGNDEIYRLADAFDTMLDKIEVTVENEKQFTSDASHELRTPVAVINSECEYVLECAKTVDEAKESVNTIKRQSDKMAKLIAELLIISRMDRNTLKTGFEKIDMSELLGFVCDEQEEIHDGDITMERDIEPCVYVVADHMLIARMFINLISNAYSYGKPGGTVKVGLRGEGNKVIVNVSDDGIGIARENLPKIWERFYQVDSSRNNERGSLGLGLSMVKWIAECHGGKISVTSELGVGTEFMFVMTGCK